MKFKCHRVPVGGEDVADLWSDTLDCIAIACGTRILKPLCGFKATRLLRNLDVSTGRDS